MNLFNKEQMYEEMKEWRGISPDDTVCKRCGGSGRMVYGDTSTWSRGVGGQAMTADVCYKCWGSGTTSRKGANLRDMTRMIKDLTRALAHHKRALSLACEVIHSTKCNILFKEECHKIASVPKGEVKATCGKCRYDHFIKLAKEGE